MAHYYRRLLFLLLILYAPNIEAQIVPAFTWTPSGGCAPQVVQFTNASTGNITSYSWNFGNSTAPSGFQNPSTSYINPGTYTVTLTATGPSGSQSVSHTITIYPPPTVSFTFSTGSGCAPLAVIFTPTVSPGVPGAVTYYWDFGDGYTSTLQNANHSYATSGVYTPKVTVTNSKGCSTTLISSNSISVLPKPTGSFSVYPSRNCSLPASVAFTNAITGNGPFTINWNFGNGTGSGSNPVNTYYTVGLFSVTMIMTDVNGCKDSVVQHNVVSTQANLAAFTAPATACDSSNVPFMDMTPSSSTTHWNFGDGTGWSTGSPTTHVFSSPGTYNVKMVSLLTGGCLDTLIKSIVINPKPVVGLSYTFPCPPPSQVQFNPYSNSPGTTYSWTWTSGGTSTQNNPTHSYSTARIDTVILVGTSALGCTDTVENDSVFVYDAPLLTSSNPYKGCIPVNAIINTGVYTTIPCAPWNLQPCPAPYPFPITSYSWIIDGVLSGTSSNNVHDTFRTPGPHIITVTVTTSNGCTLHDTLHIKVGTPVPPSFTGGPDTVCVKVPLHFTNTTNDTGISYLWDFGDGTFAQTYNADQFYTVPGTYTVKLTSDYNGCEDSISKFHLVTILPSDAHFRDSIYCYPSTTVSFVNTSIGATSAFWTFGDGSPSSSALSVVHTYPGPGVYNAMHITYNNIYGCRDTLTDSIHIVPISLAFAASDTTLCQGDTLHLQATYSGPPLDYMGWNINGFHDISDPSIKFHKDTVISVTGFQSIQLYISTDNHRCIDSTVKTNYVIVSHPQAAFAPDVTVGCVPLTVKFSDSTRYTPGTARGSIFWIFGNGDTATSSNATRNDVYTAAGFYNVKMVVKDWNGCPDSVVHTQLIEARKPSALYQVSSPNGCVNAPLTFNNFSAGATFLNVKWFFGDGDSSTAHFTVSHIYRAPGVYNARLIVFDSTGCSDTMVKPITVTQPHAQFNLSDTLAVCPPLIVSFTSTSTSANSYAWNFNNGGSAAIPNPVSTFSAPGIYNVRLIITDPAGCQDTAYAKVRVLGYAGAFSFGPMSGCKPLTVNFNCAISNAPNIVWDYADGSTAPGIGLTSTHTYNVPGAYVPKLIFANTTGCKASSVAIDTIKVDGIIAGFKVLPPCEKTNLQLLDTSYSYFSPLKDSHWDFGGMGIATGNQVNHMYANAGTYAVTLISTNAQGCKDTLTSNLTIFPLPKVRAMDDTSLCVPDGISLGASGAKTYTWSPGMSLSCTNCPNPIASPTVATSYVVTGTDSNGCMNKDTVRIGIQTKTTFVTSGNAEICLGDRVKLLVAGATIYSWTPAGSLDDPNSDAPYASPNVTTTYVITGKEGSCAVDTHMVTVVVHPIPTVDAGGNLKVIAGRGVQLQASGSGITRVVWDNDSTLSCTTCFGPIAKPRQTTTYHIKAYNDFGCSTLDSVTVTVLCDGSQLFIPNTFSPNGDGNNDHFFARGNGINNLKSMRVYSRWGELLYERLNVQVNDESAGWDGTHNGRILNPDVFVYVIEATCDSGEPILFKGDVTLIK